MSDDARTMLDRYELIAPIARGGMGSVHLARLAGAGGFQRLYAIKRMHPHLADEEEFVAMLLDEARLAARIHHTNAVAIIDVREHPEGPFVVMDYVDGVTLARLAAGDASELVSATLCATAAPVVLAPSMNHAMLTAPAVQENLSRVRARGVRVAHAAVGYEVADDPAHRDEMLGPAMAPGAFAKVIDAVAAALPLRAHDWETLYARDLPRPWEVPRDAALDELLRVFAPPETHPRMLELGCGLGDHAIARTHEGWTVTALDVSARAIARAASRESVVTWVCDDVTRSRLHGRFDVVVDRGCLHALDAAGRARCAAQVARWLRPEGVWVLKAHAEGGVDVGTTRFSPDALDASVGEGFVRGAMRAVDFGGSAAQPSLVAAYVRR